jgi:hypothetical protein
MLHSMRGMIVDLRQRLVERLSEPRQRNVVLFERLAEQASDERVRGRVIR